MARQDVGEPYYRISVDEAKEILDSGGDVTVIDVRSSEEFQSGHVPGAIHIPVDEILTRFNELPDGQKMLFICAAGVRSGLACEMAAAMGQNVDLLYNIEDGTPIWIEKNYPVSYGMDR